MKKRDLEKKLSQIAKEAGYKLEQAGGTKHDKYRVNGTVITVPRHKEINELTAKAIIKDCQDAVTK